MTIKFDEDAVSENIRNLLAQGVGRTIDGVPSFNNADIELHQNIIRRERGLSPLTAVAPTGINVNTQGLTFDGLNDPGRQGMRDITLRIGELEGQKLQISSSIAALIQNDIAVVAADDAVAALSEELVSVPLDQNEIRAEIQGDLVQATTIAKKVREDAILRAGVDEKKRLSLVDQDIAKLTAQQSVLQLEQAEQDKILARRGFSDTVLRTVVTANLAKDLDQADKLLRTAPPAFQEMTRRIATGIASENYIEAFDSAIDAGGRKEGEDMIVNGAPPELQDEVRAALLQNAERMVTAREQAAKDVRGAAAVKDPTLRGNPKAVAEREIQIYDGLMRDASFGGYERVLLGTQSDELDASWFNNNTELLEVGKLIMDMVPPDADNMETAFAVVGQRLINQRIDRDLILRAMGKIIDSRANSWNRTNKFLGLSVSRKKLEAKTQAISFNIFNIARIDAGRRQAAAAVTAEGSAADIGPLGLFGLSSLQQGESFSGLGVETPIPEEDIGGAEDASTFQAPSLGGLVPSDASRNKLQQLAKSIVSRATRQAEARPAPRRASLEGTSPSPASREKAESAGALTNAAITRIIDQFDGTAAQRNELEELLKRGQTTAGVRS